MAGGRLQTNVDISEPAVDSYLVTARSASQRIYVQHINYSPTNYVAGTILSFVDSITQVSIGVITVVPASAGADANQYHLNYDDDGTPLSVGASLQLKVLSGGVSGRMDIDAYQLPLYVVTPRVTSQTAGFTA